MSVRPIPRTRSDLVPLLEGRGLRLSRRRGQNFLVDPAMADAIVADAGVQPDDTVIEIGPGAGALTQPLLAAARRVVAVELDRGLGDLLAEHLGDDPRLELVVGDALAGSGATRLHPAVSAALDDPGGGRVLVVSNLPYSVGTAVITELLSAPVGPAAIVAMLQSEVVERLRAEPGSQAFGLLAVTIALRARVDVVRKVPRSVFFPRPDVESTVFRLTPLATDDPCHATASEAAAVHELAGRAFQQRRKRIRKTLSGVVGDAEFQAAEIDSTARPEAVDPAAWLRLIRQRAGRVT